MIGPTVAALLILSAIGSLMWTLPSKADRRRAALRQKAISRGLTLTTLSVPDTSDRGRINGLSRLVTGYKRRAPELARLPPFITLRSTGEAGFGLPDGWVWENPDFRASPPLRAALTDILLEMPPWVELLGVLPDGLVVTFDERQGAEHFERVEEMLASSTQKLVLAAP